MAKEIKLFCPATVANVACGYDVLGFCLDAYGDDMIVRQTKTKGIHLVPGSGFPVPLDPMKNTAGLSAMALYDNLDVDFGFEIEIHKRIKPGSGVGSSAASAIGSVFGINELLGRPYSKTELTVFDNLAPVLFGGFTLVRSVRPMDVLSIPYPESLHATIIHPEIEIKTADARGLVPTEINIQLAIQQWANLGALIHALHTADFDLMTRALQDVIVEPARKSLIPQFDRLKQGALDQGGLGCSISGSGPSVFALSKDRDTAQRIAEHFKAVYETSDISFRVYVSPINPKGVKTIV